MAVRRGLLTIVGVIALLSAQSHASAVAETGQAADPATRAEIEQQLLSLGIDPAVVTWQVGPLNYAGPNCPGPEWNCALADRPVVQIALQVGTNEVDCTPTTDKCVAFQTGSGNNIARCIQHSTANPAEQTCMITQETESPGSNHAVVHQVIEQNGDPDQEGTQDAMVSQDTTSGQGKNEVNIDQRISQKTDEVETDITGASQSQETVQTSTVDQDAAEGSNSAKVTVRLDQDETATVPAGLVQEQNGAAPEFPPPDPPDPFTLGPDQDTEVTQDADEGGNAVALDHVLRQAQDGTSVDGPVAQTQGSFNGGQEAHLHQNGEDVSTKFADQSEMQDQLADAPGDPIQVQFDPQRCCNDQTGNENNVTDIEQDATQTASGDATTTQDGVQDADCTTDGGCNFDQTANQQAGDDAMQFINQSGSCSAEGEGGCTGTQTATQNGETDTNECDEQGSPSCSENFFCTDGFCGED